MKFGSDFWLILRIVIAVARALLEFFGDDEDKEEMTKNGF
jgi:hypothetical protein